MTLKKHLVLQVNYSGIYSRGWQLVKANLPGVHVFPEILFCDGIHVVDLSLALRAARDRLKYSASPVGFPTKFITEINSKNGIAGPRASFYNYSSSPTPTLPTPTTRKRQKKTPIYQLTDDRPSRTHPDPLPWLPPQVT